MGSKYILGGSDLLSKEAEDRKYRKNNSAWLSID